jgi:hypothetical protein
VGQEYVGGSGVCGWVRTQGLWVGPEYVGGSGRRVCGWVRSMWLGQAYVGGSGVCGWVRTQGMWVGQDGGVAEYVRRGWAQWHAQCSLSRVCPLTAPGMPGVSGTPGPTKLTADPTQGGALLARCGLVYAEAVCVVAGKVRRAASASPPAAACARRCLVTQW